MISKEIMLSEKANPKRLQIITFLKWQIIEMENKFVIATN